MTILIVLLSYRYLGGTYMLPVYILLAGISTEFIADFGFSVTTTKETYFVGSWVDMLFMTGIYLVSVSLVLFSTQRLEEHKHVS
jgi:hypothetical protein